MTMAMQKEWFWKSDDFIFATIEKMFIAFNSKRFTLDSNLIYLHYGFNVILP